LHAPQTCYPEVVFSRTLNSVEGNARLAERSVAEEVATALGATDKTRTDVRLAGDLRVLRGRPRPIRGQYSFLMLK
jgi:hypothetical protein